VLLERIRLTLRDEHSRFKVAVPYIMRKIRRNVVVVSQLIYETIFAGVHVRPSPCHFLSNTFKHLIVVLSFQEDSQARSIVHDVVRRGASVSRIRLHGQSLQLRPVDVGMCLKFPS